MKNKFTEWSKRKYTERQRFLALIPEGILFVVIIPLILIIVPSWIDSLLDLPVFVYQPVNMILGTILIVSGLLFAIWSIQVQFEIGKGTPAPMMPTQKLVDMAPYNCCRNPMAFGTIVFYMGVVVCTGSISSFVLFALLIGGLLMYIKFIEEKELEERFGEEYLEYKESTPFLIPGCGQSHLK